MGVLHLKTDKVNLSQLNDFLFESLSRIILIKVCFIHDFKCQS